MSSESGIEWCDRSWEVTAGCTKVSSGCANCYAETLVGTRLVGMARKRKAAGQDTGTGLDLSLKVINAPKGKPPRWNGHIELLEMNLDQPLRRRAPTVYFVNSRSDLFHEDVPFEYIDRVFAVMALCPRHRFLVLTKRPERMRAYLIGGGVVGRSCSVYEQMITLMHVEGERRAMPPAALDSVWWPLPNVWLGTSVEDQATADARLPHLLACPAAGRFISAEPLLGAVDFTQVRIRHRVGCRRSSIDHIQRVSSSNPLLDMGWVIVGGESGAGARPCGVGWVRSVKNQCRDAGVPVFVKQLGADPRKPFNEESCEGYAPELKLKNRKGADMDEWPVDLRVREVPEGLCVGKGSGISHQASGGGKTPSVGGADTSPAGAEKERKREACGGGSVSAGKPVPGGMQSDEPGSAYTIGGR